MITDIDVIKLKKTFTTKDDLEKTNKKLGKIEGVVNNLAIEVVGIKSEIVQIKETMVIKDEFREVMTALDVLAGDVKTIREEQAMHFQSHDDNRLEHIEIKARLKRIEAATVDLGVR